MSKLRSQHVFTSESVGEGHPDKVCDQISDAVLDACLKADPESRVACETMVAPHFVANAGEITCAGFEGLNTEEIARRVVERIGYTDEALGFSSKTFEYVSRLHGQSPDISQGVSEGEGLYDEQGAGDQGMMFGYATDETPERMPCPVAYSHRLLQDLARRRRDGSLGYLRPDSKAQVSVRYADGRPVEIPTVVISHQTEDRALSDIRADLVDVAREVLEPTGLVNKKTEFHVNPTGAFVRGGPYADSGLTGRKIIVDTYGGVGSHGGGAFSGKDPSKVDRSAAYFARYVAKNVLEAGLARKCEVQVAYAIGIAAPISINVDTYGTGVIPDENLSAILESGEVFDFRPAAMIDELNLKTPKGWSYLDSACYGHFGRGEFSWEKTDKAEELKRAASMRAAG
jgi:S-adenosylmethionine synthetase